MTPSETNDRQGLTGALPAGNKWRAQGYIGGTTRYLGTFDTEEEASAVFLHEKEQVDAATRSEAEAAIDRILASPTYVYEGGKGRGATLNGQRFKTIEASGPHQMVCVPILSDGSLGFDAQKIILSAYLREEPKTPEMAQITIAAERPTEQAEINNLVTKGSLSPEYATIEEIRRFTSRHTGCDLEWTLHFIIKHGKPEVAAVAQALLGNGSIPERLDWLQFATNIPKDTLRQLEMASLQNAFHNEDSRAAQRVLPKAFPDSFDDAFREEEETLESLYR